ncbi:MAG TPA: DUF6077 domain-containing protein [Vicinamibacteria bacterium]|nr:DUF6077 domain-containing protein [Vicinamibacteria bacterium]
MEEANRASRPLADRLVDAACLVFAAWTILCHGVVFAGQSLIVLIGIALAAAVSAGAVLSVRALRAICTRRSGDEPSRPAEGAPLAVTGFAASDVTWLVALAAVFVAPVVSRSLNVAWWVVLIYLALLLVRGGRSASPAAPETSCHRGSQALVWLLAVGAVVVTLTAQRPDMDDAYYIGVAVGAADAPNEPLLATDSLHGIPGLPLLLSVYRVQSLELAWGALAYLTGVPAITWSHLAFPALAAVLVVLAYARLLKHLIPDRWAIGLVVVVLIFVVVGETHRWYSNFAFVRLQQGKGIFLSVMVPLLVAYALEYSARPGRSRWLRLAAASVASVGLTVTALWIVPLVAGLGLVCGLTFTRRGAIVAAGGALTSLYPVLLALGLSRTTTDRLSVVYPSVKGSHELITGAVHAVLGDSMVALLSAVALLTAWRFVAAGTARRFCILFPLGLVLLLFNPYTASTLARRITSEPTFWRGFWLIPLPAFLAVTLTAPLRLRGTAWRLGVGIASTTALLLASLGLAPRIYVLSKANGTAVAPFELKVPRDYRAAAALVRHVRPGASVIAPLRVTPWLTTFHHHPYPLVVRPDYLKSYVKELGQREVTRRMTLTSAVTPRIGRALDVGSFMNGVATYDVKGVCLPRGLPWGDEYAKALARAGFESVYRDDRDDVWVDRAP